MEETPFSSHYTTTQTKGSEYHSPFLPVEPQNLHSAAAPWTHHSSSLPVLQAGNSTEIGLGTTVGRNHPRTDADCIRNIFDHLSFVERVQSEKTLTDNRVMKSIICRATDFAIAITCGIERAQSMLSEARLIRSSGNAHDLHRFAGELQPALMKIQRDISHAQSGIDVSFLGVDYSRNRPLFCY
ncbi:hypothetical protein SCLCIDRAFT_1212148 [Scleroderma citrinum Foug A]|uniref:Uncharacterized protein n=1 Tax=Scleroderma citrinum Foug A TaxID=1036808 RepID=A0A0C3AKC6_9AGAM|nr:hypothetical protein SCLCIDRAFT_1212148 [Scleroderma citrinum Foug A]